MAEFRAKFIFWATFGRFFEKNSATKVALIETKTPFFAPVYHLVPRIFLISFFKFLKKLKLVPAKTKKLT